MPEVPEAEGKFRSPFPHEMKGFQRRFSQDGRGAANPIAGLIVKSGLESEWQPELRPADLPDLPSPGSDNYPARPCLRAARAGLLAPVGSGNEAARKVRTPAKEK